MSGFSNDQLGLAILGLIFLLIVDNGKSYRW